MKTAIRVIIIGFLILHLLSFQTLSKKNISNKEKTEYAERVKKAFLKGWHAYKSYAWGMDGVNPISKKGHNWYK